MAERETVERSEKILINSITLSSRFAFVFVVCFCFFVLFHSATSMIALYLATETSPGLGRDQDGAEI